nr:MAG TPA: hypothetical protein [Caudoviricetes sp.]
MGPGIIYIGDQLINGDELHLFGCFFHNFQLLKLSPLAGTERCYQGNKKAGPKVCLYRLFIFRMFFKKIWVFFQNLFQQLLIHFFSLCFSKMRQFHRSVINITDVVYFFWGQF